MTRTNGGGQPGMVELVAAHRDAERRVREAEKLARDNEAAALARKRDELTNAALLAVEELASLPNVTRIGPLTLKVFERRVHLAVQEVRGTSCHDDADPQPYVNWVIRWTGHGIYSDAAPPANRFVHGGHCEVEQFRKWFAAYIAELLDA